MSYLDDLFSLEGLNAVVTGGSSGIGRGIATALAGAGASVHLVARDADKLATVAAEIGARTVAFPAISAGVYGWPMDDAARIAVRTVLAADTSVDTVVFVPFSDAAEQAFRDALAEDS